jgi:hypothetical protein
MHWPPDEFHPAAAWLPAWPHRVKVDKIVQNRTNCFAYLIYSADRAQLSLYDLNALCYSDAPRRFAD